jgi:hypothetical protein
VCALQGLLPEPETACPLEWYDESFA